MNSSFSKNNLLIGGKSYAQIPLVKILIICPRSRSLMTILIKGNLALGPCMVWCQSGSVPLELAAAANVGI